MTCIEYKVIVPNSNILRRKLRSKMKQIAALAIFLFGYLMTNYAMALTEKDCRTRVNNAMHNSDRLGGNDSDAYRWAQNAADECYKELAKNTSKNTASNNSSSSGIGASFILSIFLLGILGYLLFRPRLATENEARLAYKKLSKLYEPDPSDHPLILEYKQKQIEGMSDGLNYLIEEIKKKDPFITQYFIKEMESDAIKDLEKCKIEVKEYGKIKINISEKICKDIKCRTSNLNNANECIKCGKSLPSAEEIIASIEEYDQKKRIDKKLIDEQNDALKKSFYDFGLLIESRARALDESQLARVCEAYITGKLKYNTSNYFNNSDRDLIYARTANEGLFDDIDFPIKLEKAEEIAIESIGLIYNKIPTNKKEKLWEDKVRKIYGWASFFQEETSDDYRTNSPLYKKIKESNGKLLLNIQFSIAKMKVEDRARSLSSKKLPYTSAKAILFKNIPFATELTDEFILEFDKIGHDLHSELELKRGKRSQKKTNTE